ncbi:hypothetical protein WJX84_005320 [Apatococcus fuscideae]
MNERAAAFLEAINKQTQIDQVDTRIASLLHKADDHRRRRAFFLAFSQSPVDFTNALIASQGRDLYAASQEGTPEFEALRRTDLFKGKWVEDAVLRCFRIPLVSFKYSDGGVPDKSAARLTAPELTPSWQPGQVPLRVWLQLLMPS